MSRKQYSKELKLKLVKKHLEDGISYWKLGKEYGIEASIIRRWGHKYETFGEDGLEKQNADLCNYSAEFKKKIVLEYLGGNITSQDLAAKYKIHAPSTVRTWIKQYNNHEDLTNSRKEGMPFKPNSFFKFNVNHYDFFINLRDLHKIFYTLICLLDG